MLNENLIPCMEQKVILLTKLLNLTKQIEVRCKQKEIVLDNLLQERQTYMERLAKCNHLIKTTLAKSDHAEQEHLEQILAVKIDAKKCTEEEQQLLQFAINSQKLQQNILTVDKNATHYIESQYNELKDIVSNNRRGKNANMFSDFK